MSKLVGIDRRLGLLDARGDYEGRFVLGLRLPYVPGADLVSAEIASSEDFVAIPAPLPNVDEFRDRVERSPAFARFSQVLPGILHLGGTDHRVRLVAAAGLSQASATSPGTECAD
jgi:hypothetical protein